MSSELARRASRAAASRRRNPYDEMANTMHAETGLQLTATRAMSTAGQEATHQVAEQMSRS